MQMSEFQRLIEQTYYERDKARGLEGTFMWFVEEVGELATALRENGDRKELANEFADVMAWLCTLASIAGIEVENAVRKYAHGCPGCRQTPCTCSKKG